MGALEATERAVNTASRVSTGRTSFSGSSNRNPTVLRLRRHSVLAVLKIDGAFFAMTKVTTRKQSHYRYLDMKKSTLVLNSFTGH